jgi:hypothetical protein
MAKFLFEKRPDFMAETMQQAITICAHRLPSAPEAAYIVQALNAAPPYRGL